jgi:hypothetical protein
MIDHLCLKTAIKMTTAQKHEYKTMGYNNPWDPTTSITAYFTQLDCFQVSLGDRGIATSEAEKTMAAGAHMWQSKMLTEDQMVTWENKTAAQQTGAALQAYFTEKCWNACSTPRRWQNNCDSKRQRFSPKKQQQPRKKENRRPCCLQCYRNNNKQIAVMTSTKKANMDAMMERMNAIMAGGGEKQTAQQDKENTPPGWDRRPPAGTGTGTDQTKKPRKQKALCPHCKMFVLHKPDNCPKLEANEDKRWPGWKSIHAIA